MHIPKYYFEKFNDTASEIRGKQSSEIIIVIVIIMFYFGQRSACKRNNIRRSGVLRNAVFRMFSVAFNSRPMYNGSGTFLVSAPCFQRKPSFKD